MAEIFQGELLRNRIIKSNALLRNRRDATANGRFVDVINIAEGIIKMFPLLDFSCGLFIAMHRMTEKEIEGE